MFLNILVAVDGAPAARAALEHAVALARMANARLTLITVAPLASQYVTLAGVSPGAMQEELERWAAGVLAEAVATVPDDVLTHTVQRTGHAGAEIVRELERGHYDLVVLGSRGRGRIQEGLLGSVNGVVHFHSAVPLLSVPADDDRSAHTP